MDARAVNVAQVVPRTEAEGPGWRFAVWVQGCPLRCKGCCNPEMLPFVGGQRVKSSDLVHAALAADVEGVSFLGGEPFAHALALAEVAEGVRAEGLSVMVFSGFTQDQLQARHDPGGRRLLAATDLLVDGPYVERLRTTERRWVGSSNQGLRFLTDRYHPDDPRFSAANHLEIRWVDGELQMNGWPLRGARTKVP